MSRSHAIFMAAAKRRSSAHRRAATDSDGRAATARICRDLIETLASKDRELQHTQLKIEQLTHEMAVLKRWKFAARSEQLHGTQRSCSTRRSTPISKPSRWSSPRCGLRNRRGRPGTNRSVVRCRRTCRAWKCAMSRNKPFAVAAAR